MWLHVCIFMCICVYMCLYVCVCKTTKEKEAVVLRDIKGGYLRGAGRRQERGNDVIPL